METLLLPSGAPALPIERLVLPVISSHDLPSVSSLYITCGLGTGSRDGLMTGLHHRTGVRVGRVRLMLEVSALLIGTAMGGSLGIGTALFALLIGQSVAISLGVVSRLTAK